MTDPSTLSAAEEREFLLRSIRDLDAEHAAGDLDDLDYRALRDDYVARAAAAIRRGSAVDEPGPAAHRSKATNAAADPTTSVPSAATPSTVKPSRVASTRGRRIAVAGLVVAAALGAGYLVAASTGERVDGAAATGSFPEASTDRIARAQRLVRDGDILEAIKVYDGLLADDPENPVALAERGWLLSRIDAGLVDRGLQGIEKAIAVDPGYPEAHFYRGMILLQIKDDPAGAVTSFEAALDADPPPDLRGFLEQTLATARERAAGGTGSSIPSGPVPSGSDPASDPLREGSGSTPAGDGSAPASGSSSGEGP